MWTQLPPRKRGTSTPPNFGPRLLWPLGTEVELGPGLMVLDGVPDPAPRKGHSSPPLFGPCLLWPRSPISATAELLYVRLLSLLLSAFYSGDTLYTETFHTTLSRIGQQLPVWRNDELNVECHRKPLMSKHSNICCVAVTTLRTENMIQRVQKSVFGVSSYHYYHRISYWNLHSIRHRTWERNWIILEKPSFSLVD